MLDKKINIPKLKDKKKVKKLTRLLNNSNDSEKIQVLWALGEIGNHNSILPLILAINEGKNFLNNEIIRTLSKFDSEKVIELLNYTAFHINVPKKDERHKWL